MVVGRRKGVSVAGGVGGRGSGARACFWCGEGSDSVRRVKMQIAYPCIANSGTT